MKIVLFSCFLLANIRCSSSVLYKSESHLHNKWLLVNVTCPEEGGSVSEKQVKRSIAYDAFRSDVALSEIQPFDLLNVTGYVPESHYLSTTGNQSSKLDVPALYSNSSNDSKIEGNASTTFDDGTAATENDSSIKSSVTINCESFEVNSNITEPLVKHLRLKSSGKLSFTENWANDLNKLLVLNINSENGLSFPSDNCSWVPSSLVKLDLSQTNLNQFSLSNCPPALRELYLQGTSLENLSLCTEYLEELDAAWNLLQGGGIIQSCEDGTSNVQTLKLHNNELDHWSSCGWDSLTGLELQKNEIKYLNLSSCILHNLLEINLSYNKLKEAPQKYPPKLTSIDLSHNHIEKISHFHRNVQEVDLSHNNLANITKGTFRSASQLLSLDLSYNELTTIYGHDFAGLHSLRYLDLSHNSIMHIRHEAFMPLRFIIRLNIDNNKLHQLDARLLANLPNNFQFRIHNNPWRCGCHLLSSLSRASKFLCKPHCHQQPELTCRERDTEVLAENILRQCLAAVQESNYAGSPVDVLHGQQNSDEDTSEEKKDSYPISYYMIIPTVALFVGIPLIGLAVRTIYLNRKNMKRCCNCLANSPNVRWTQQRNVDRESDSETEF